MKYSLGLHHLHPLDPAFVTPEFVRDFARTAEEAGFDAVFFTEHPMPGDDWLATGGHDALDPFVNPGAERIEAGERLMLPASALEPTGCLRSR